MRLERIAPQDPIALTPAMVGVLHFADAFAPAATPVLLHGETGTGKTFLAEYIHRLSGRAGGFHVFSAGTVQPQLAASDLFGHVRGAFTDAHRMRAGLLATAGAGTLLLDDLHVLELGVQRQLLLALDRGIYRPVGSDRVLTLACRMIFAMTDAPDVLMDRGLLLPDLRFRFGACSARIPPLRERRAEIPVLAQRALERCPELAKLQGPARFSDETIMVLCEAELKGNVRQLEWVVLAAFVVAGAAGAPEIRPQHLPEEVLLELQFQRRGDPRTNRVAVERALRRADGNVKRAAKLLGVNRNTVHAVLAYRSAAND